MPQLALPLVDFSGHTLATTGRTAASLTVPKVAMMKMRTGKTGSRTCKKWTECGTVKFASLHGVPGGIAETGSCVDRSSTDTDSHTRRPRRWC